MLSIEKEENALILSILDRPTNYRARSKRRCGRGLGSLVVDWSKKNEAWEELGALLWSIGKSGEGALNVYAHLPLSPRMSRWARRAMALDERFIRDVSSGLLIRLGSLADLFGVPSKVMMTLSGLQLVYTDRSLSDISDIRPRTTMLIFSDYTAAVYQNLGEYDSLADIVMPEADSAWYSSAIHSASDLQRRVLDAATAASISVTDEREREAE